MNKQRVIELAKKILNRRFRRGAILTSPDMSRDYLQLHLQTETYEVFCVMYLDNQHRILAFDKAFHGTIDGASVYPRVIAARALELNAAAVIFAHNHPSGVAEPSKCDEEITIKLKNALALFDIKVLDHFVVGETLTSFAEKGLL